MKYNPENPVWIVRLCNGQEIKETCPLCEGTKTLAVSIESDGEHEAPRRKRICCPNCFGRGYTIKHRTIYRPVKCRVHRITFAVLNPCEGPNITYDLLLDPPAYGCTYDVPADEIYPTEAFAQAVADELNREGEESDD